ncbi:copper chaperone PCu(A)C [Actinoplanes sp. NEAU-A12]|uniref:Copper chaperone PCu(A)C n=1 Tax=Actinoplanes sandaracinus TaxID=3045177 RepID=A0ABT6WS47_9ACTN|nr:copper chaperone PCu(A)C [Actinoplanes sandaracinus]MDI6102571.1 copper chaperone PCu(A)C [Actinoplanes sandaracinus]
MLTRTVLASAVLACAFLAGCGSSSEPSKASAPAASSAAPAAALTVRDPWVKAADTGMTAAFGTLVNNTGADVTIESATSPASPLELHTMAMQDGKMVMRPKEGGFVIKAGATHELSPGGDHLMLMKPSAAIKPGDELSFTLKLSGGGTVAFTAVAKPFAGAQESYDPGMHGSMPSASASAHS